MKLLFCMAISSALVGCANMDPYYQAVDAANARQAEVARARAEADAVRYQALMRVAESGDASAKVAAAMALALGGQGRTGAPLVTPAVPQNEALQWASVLVPELGRGLQTVANLRMALKNSDNTLARAQAEVARDQALYGGFVTLGTTIKDGATAGYPWINPTPVITPEPTVVVVPPPEPVIVEPSYPPAQAM